MKERQILFSAPMVRAILSGYKTVTRRVVKFNKFDDIPAAIYPDGSGTGFISWWGQGPFTAKETVKFYPGEDGWKCPYGVPGDRLWVREAWQLSLRGTDDGGFTRLIKYPADGFEAVVSPEYFDWFDKKEERGYKGRPSIHLPRWASRITLEVTDVRVERLQKIKDSEARAEGLAIHEWEEGEVFSWKENQQPVWGSAVSCFADLWDSINGDQEGCSWHDNPWVWVVEFKRI